MTTPSKRHDWIARAEARAERHAANRAEHDKVRAEALARVHAENREQRGHKGAIRRAARLMDRAARAAPASTPGIPDPRLMSDAELLAWVGALLEADRYDWRATARPDQIQPENYRTWVLLHGRGAGKTRAATEAVREWCNERPGCHVAVVAKDHKALRDVNFDGPSGLISCIPKVEQKTYKRGLGDVMLELTNGSIIYGFSSGEPDSTRGRSFECIVADEYASWARNTARDALDQAVLCLRDSANPRLIITTTPKRVPHIIELVDRAEKGEPGLVVTRGRTSDNTALSQVARDELYRMYGGTRLGRQELEGILLTDVDNALFTVDFLEGARWTSEEDFPPMVGVITGVDPSGSETGDATGIVTCGWDANRVIYVLENRSTKGTPAHRYSEVCRSARRWGAGQIWSESAFSGDSSIYGIGQQWKNLVESGEFPDGSVCPVIKPSTIKGDKAARAYPVAQLYEQQLITGKPRIWHPVPTVGNGIAALEEEMLSWSTDSKKSPNAIDAMVHAARQIMRRTGQEAVASSAARSKRRIGRGYRPF